MLCRGAGFVMGSCGLCTSCPPPTWWFPVVMGGRFGGYGRAFRRRLRVASSLGRGKSARAPSAGLLSRNKSTRACDTTTLSCNKSAGA